MEVALAAKRKLGFVTGGEKKDASDPIKGEAWETCNNMVIAWIMGSVSSSIKQSIAFVKDAAVIWKQLESRFAVTNGSRKYRLCKQMFEIKQQNRKIADFYTVMKIM